MIWEFRTIFPFTVISDISSDIMELFQTYQFVFSFLDDIYIIIVIKQFSDGLVETYIIQSLY